MPCKNKVPTKCPETYRSRAVIVIGTISPVSYPSPEVYIGYVKDPPPGPARGPGEHWLLFGSVGFHIHTLVFLQTVQTWWVRDSLLYVSGRTPGT